MSAVKIDAIRAGFMRAVIVLKSIDEGIAVRKSL
jgi:hypothetical protein